MKRWPRSTAKGDSRRRPVSRRIAGRLTSGRIREIAASSEPRVSLFWFHALPSCRTARALETPWPHRGNRLDRRVRAVFALRIREPAEFSVCGFRESDDSRSGASVLQLVSLLSIDDSRRHAGGADGAGAVRGLFFRASRDAGLCFFGFLVLREFSLYRNVHGGCARRGAPARWLRRSRLEYSLRRVGPAAAGCAHRRNHAARRLGRSRFAHVRHLAPARAAKGRAPPSRAERASLRNFGKLVRTYSSYCGPVGLTESAQLPGSTS